MVILAFFLLTLNKKNTNNFAVLFEYTKNCIEFIYANNYKKCFFLI